jgi:hypothetical protein
MSQALIDAESSGTIEDHVRGLSLVQPDPADFAERSYDESDGVPLASLALPSQGTE